jgi:hypothetical protein
MAIIYSYPETLELLPADMLIGTSTIRVAGKKKNITKNFTLELLKNFILDGVTNVQWGTITGTLSNQTDLQAALNAKQNNITLTTTGSSGPATLVGATLNVPDYSTGITVPTLDQVLTAGNTSIIDAKVGNLYSYDNVNADYGIVQFYDSGVSLKSATTNHLLFFNDDTGTVKFSNGTYLPTLNFAGVGNNIYTFQNANGTLAFTSDIPSLTGYVPTSRTLTINGTLYDLTANRSWSVGTVTSIGMTVPSAFNVTPSTITSSGTFAITGAGAASQYVRGDGTLANFPTSTGGGASVSYYLNGSVSQGTIGGVAYKEMNGVPVIGTGTDFTINADGYIAQFITDVGDPNKLLIPAGNWNFETYFSASSNGGTPRFYIELYKYDGATFTLIATNSATPEYITGGTSIDLYLTALAVPSTSLLITDRLAVRFYVIHSGRTITMHTENSHLSQIITTFSSGLTALNGLTSQVQYFAVGTAGLDFNILSVTDTHTFNLPTASAANRGALNSADWITFNGKFNLPALTSGSVLFSNGTTIAQDNANLFWDDTNNRLGIGTATPTHGLNVYTTVADTGILLDSNTNPAFIIKRGGVERLKLTASGSIGTINGLGNGLAFQTDSVERMRFSTTGNALINTGTDNGGKLQIKAPGALSTDIALRVRNSADSADLMLVNGLGNVGIGTASPLVKLHVVGTGESEVRVSENTNNNYITLYQQALTSYLIAGRTGATSVQPLAIYTGGSERMRIQADGNVGIGTTAPATKLDVNGVGTFMASNTPTLLTKISGSYGQVITMARNGAGNNVGIGVAQSGELSFYTNNVETMRIHSNGSLLMGTTTLIGSSKLTIESTTQGFLPPRMTNAQRIAIATPAVGLCVYCTDVVEGLYINKSTGWTYIG